MSDDRGDGTTGERIRRRILAGVYGAAIALGYVLGAGNRLSLLFAGGHPRGHGSVHPSGGN